MGYHPLFIHSAVKWSSRLKNPQVQHILAVCTHTQAYLNQSGSGAVNWSQPWSWVPKTCHIWVSYVQCAHGMSYTAVWVMGCLELQFKCDFRSTLWRAMPVKFLFCHLAACLSFDMLHVPCFHGSIDRWPCASPSSPILPNLGLASPAVECIRPQNGSSAAAVAQGEKPDRPSSCRAQTGQGHSKWNLSLLPAKTLLGD